jgi:hypothetical protein
LLFLALKGIVVATKKKKQPGVTEFRGGEVLKTNKLYIALREIGQCNEKGKSVLSCGYSGKFIAHPDKPLQTLMVPLINEIMKFLGYSDDKLAEEDIKVFKEWVNSIKLN